MSKVTELRAKYPKVNIRSFENFVKADETPTKKYLEYHKKYHNFVLRTKSLNEGPNKNNKPSHKIQKKN